MIDECNDGVVKAHGGILKRPVKKRLPLLGSPRQIHVGSCLP
jgi:hypothetical protein